MSSPQESSPSKGIRLSLFINGFLPWLAYTQMKAHTDWKDFDILCLTAILPISGAVVGLLKSRTVDIVSGLTMVGIVVGIVAVFVGGDPSLREGA